MPCHALKNIYSHDIDEILDKKIVCGKVRYLVKWKHSNKTNSWEPFECFQNVKQIDDFENKFSSRSKLTTRGEQVFVHAVKHTGIKKIISSEDKQIKKQILNIMEDELSCSICYEIVQEASVTECKHFFCDKCIKKWKNSSDSCPMCRESLSKPEIKIPVLDNLISKVNSVINK